MLSFQMTEEEGKYFSNIMAKGGSYGESGKEKFMMFDIYYFCALIGLAAIEIDKDESGFGTPFMQHYPSDYRESASFIAGLLIATEAKRIGVDVGSDKLEELMKQYVEGTAEILSSEGVKKLNAYSLRGFKILRDNRYSKPDTREEFLINFFDVLNKSIKENVNDK